MSESSRPHAEFRNWTDDKLWKLKWLLEKGQEREDGSSVCQRLGGLGRLMPGLLLRAVSSLCGRRLGVKLLARRQGRSICFAQPLLSIQDITISFSAREDTAPRGTGVAVTLASLPCTGLVICNQSFCNNSWCRPLWRSRKTKVRRVSTKRNVSTPRKPAEAPLWAVLLPSPTPVHRPNSSQDEPHFNKFGTVSLLWIPAVLKYRNSISEPAYFQPCWQHTALLQASQVNEKRWI